VLEKVKGDEVVDSVDNVHVDADKVGSGPHAGELQWNTFYSGKVVNGGAEAARGAGNICMYLYVYMYTYGHLFTLAR